MVTVGTLSRAGLWPPHACFLCGTDSTGGMHKGLCRLHFRELFPPSFTEGAVPSPSAAHNGLSFVIQCGQCTGAGHLVSNSPGWPVCVAALGYGVLRGLAPPSQICSHVKLGHSEEGRCSQSPQDTLIVSPAALLPAAPNWGTAQASISRRESQ